MSDSVLATYYRDTDFLKWIVDQQFISHNPTNIAKYYTIYQSVVVCKENKCCNCAGLYPSWKSEEDIVTGHVTTSKCARRIHETQEKRTSEFITQIPPTFADIDIDKLDRITDAARSSIKQYIALFPNNPLHGLYIYGQDHQIGKTSCLWYIVKSLIQRGMIVKGFILHTTVIFIDELQADMMTSDHILMRKARTCDILLLDDFGSEKATLWSQSKLKAIIEERIWHKRDTVLCSCIPLVPWMWTTKSETEMLAKIGQSMQTVELAKPEGSDGKHRQESKPNSNPVLPVIDSDDPDNAVHHPASNVTHCHSEDLPPLEEEEFDQSE